MYTAADITIVIPTYNREEPLVDTISALLALKDPARDLVLVDQTPAHSPATERALGAWSESGKIQRISLRLPSIPHAMNEGLLAASGSLVLFLDDDIVPGSSLVSAHAAAFSEFSGQGVACVAGQVLQPGEEPLDPDTWHESWFPFNSNRRRWIDDVMAGNLCVERQRAIELGGFDENFVGAAYKFESEFARRVRRAGGKILFEPAASLRHLRAASGGARSFGNHLTSWKPHHAVGRYYYALTGSPAGALAALVVQPLRSVRTRHHMRRPWWIPVTLAAEVAGIFYAAALRLRGQRLIPRAGSGL